MPQRGSAVAPAICRTRSAIAPRASPPARLCARRSHKTARGCAGTVRRGGRHRGLPHHGLRRRLATRNRVVRRLRPVGRVESDAARVLRRARGRQDSGRAKRHAHPCDRACCRRWRRHHGRRHRHGVRERRHPGSAQGRGSGRARPWHVGDPQELRVDDGEGPDDGGGDGTHTRAHYSCDELRRLRRRRHRRRGGVREHGPEEVHVRRAHRGDTPRRHSRVEHVDARHRRARRGERPGDTGRRAPLLQPRQRDEAARDRPRPRHQRQR